MHKLRSAVLKPRSLVYAGRNLAGVAQLSAGRSPVLFFSLAGHSHHIKKPLHARVACSGQ